MEKADCQLKIRLPLDVKAFIEAEAFENSSSQNSEIVRALRAAMKARGAVEVAAFTAPMATKSPERNVDEHSNS